MPRGKLKSRRSTRSVETCPRLAERRQGESEQQQHAAGDAIKCGRDAGPWQRHRKKAAEPGGECELGGVTDQAAGDARDDSKHDEMQQVEAHDGRLAGADAAHHRTAVQVPAQKTPRRQRDRNGGQDHADQRGKSQKALRAFERRAYLRPRVADAFQLCPAPMRVCAHAR